MSLLVPNASPVNGPPGPTVAAPAGRSLYRDRDIWADARSRVEGLGVFASVRVGEWPRSAFTSAQDRPLCLIEPRGFTESDDVDAIQVERTVRVRLTIVVSGEEPGDRFNDLDDLGRMVGNALTGVSLADASLPAKTSCPVGDYLESRHPDKALQLNLTAPYLFDGYGGRAELE